MPRNNSASAIKRRREAALNRRIADSTRYHPGETIEHKEKRQQLAVQEADTLTRRIYHRTSYEREQ